MRTDDDCITCFQCDQSFEDCSRCWVGCRNNCSDQTDWLSYFLNTVSSVFFNHTAGSGILICVVYIFGCVMVLDNLIFYNTHSCFFNSIFSKRDTCFVSSSSGSFKNLIYLLLGKCCENLLCLFHGCNLCSKGFRGVDDGLDSVLFFCHLGILLFVFSLKVFTVTCYVFIIQIN